MQIEPKRFGIRGFFAKGKAQESKNENTAFSKMANKKMKADKGDLTTVNPNKKNGLCVFDKGYVKPIVPKGLSYFDAGYVEKYPALL